MLKYLSLFDIVYMIAIAFVKLSILMLYLRVFVPNRQANRVLSIAIGFSIAVNVVYYITNTVSLIAQCVPREKIWNPFLAGGHCIDVAVIYKATGIFNILSDFAILILPMPAIWKLHVQSAKKVGLAAVFATGFLYVLFNKSLSFHQLITSYSACITSILRTYWTWKVFETPDSRGISAFWAIGL